MGDMTFHHEGWEAPGSVIKSGEERTVGLGWENMRGERSRDGGVDYVIEEEVNGGGRRSKEEKQQRRG